MLGGTARIVGVMLALAALGAGCSQEKTAAPEPAASPPTEQANPSTTEAPSGEVDTSASAAVLQKNAPEAVEEHASGTSTSKEGTVAVPTTVRVYHPSSRVTQMWGELRLGSTSASLSKFDGEMALEYVGVMPAEVGSDLADAQVYRVANARKYFTKNKGRNAFCDQPPKWLAVRAKPTETSPADSEIWLAMLTLDDWAAYRPDTQGYCGGGMFTPAPDGLVKEATAYAFQVNCNGDSFRLRFEPERATVESDDGTNLTLSRLSAANAAQDAPRTYTNGKLTFVHEGGGGKATRILFARGRMVPQPCAIAQNAP